MSCEIVFNELSTGYVTCTFRDKDKALAVPSSITYRIDNKEDNVQILDWAAFTPPLSEIEILVTDTQNGVIDQTAELEEHVLTVKAMYGSGDQITEQVVFSVKNLQFLS